MNGKYPAIFLKGKNQHVHSFAEHTLAVFKECLMESKIRLMGGNLRGCD